MTKQVDLTTLTGWSSLSDGEHTITIKAKADGYRDSQASEGVSVTKGSTGETWVLNESIVVGNENFTVNFTSNNKQYVTLRQSAPELIYIQASTDYDVAYSSKLSTWYDEAYRTITFATAPTGDLLTWLQANGTKQGGVTSGYTVTIHYSDLSSNLCFYSLDNGTTWIDGYVAGQTQLVLNNVEQIKFKVQSDYSHYCAITGQSGDSFSSLYASNGSSETSSNITLTKDMVVQFAAGID